MDSSLTLAIAIVFAFSCLLSLLAITSSPVVQPAFSPDRRLAAGRQLGLTPPISAPLSRLADVTPAILLST